MAPPDTLHQNVVFYTIPWTEQIDRFFIGLLVKELMNGNFRVGKHNYLAMECATKKINSTFETSFNVHECFQKFFLLRDRYNLFRWITRLSGVVHDPITNHIKCSDDAWEFICEKESLARAYMLHSEKMFDGLKLFFQDGPDSPEFVINVDDVEVINLTGDNEGELGKSDDGLVVEDMGDDGKGKTKTVIGKEGEPDNDWWKDVVEGDTNSASDDEVSQPFEFSSIEYVKTRDNIATKIDRRLWGDDGSSTASFSPFKKL